MTQSLKPRLKEDGTNGLGKELESTRRDILIKSKKLRKLEKLKLKK